LVQGHGQPALRAIVSGPLDADKQDYLLRDSQFCGVQYGIFDIHQLHRSLILVGPKDEEELMIDPDGIHAVEQYVLAKYYLTTNVYRHKVRLITDQMIIRAIVLGIEKDDNAALRRLYSFDPGDEFIKNYAAYDDARFMAEFGSAEKSRCGEMVKRLQDRHLLKRVFEMKVRDLNERVREIVTALPKRENDSVRTEIERASAILLKEKTGQSIDPDSVIVHAFDVKSVRESSRNDEAGILVNTSPKPRPFTDESTLFASIQEGYVDQFVEVYAPVEWGSLARKNKLRRECREEIKNLIEEKCLSALKGAAK
jgi:HD superfamily phosphohydrolase